MELISCKWPQEKDLCWCKTASPKPLKISKSKMKKLTAIISLLVNTRKNWRNAYDLTNILPRETSWRDEPKRCLEEWRTPFRFLKIKVKGINDPCTDHSAQFDARECYGNYWGWNGQICKFIFSLSMKEPMGLTWPHMKNCYFANRWLCRLTMKYANKSKCECYACTQFGFRNQIRNVLSKVAKDT